MDELGVGVEYFKSPLNGEFTGQYFTNDDGSVKVAAITMTKDVSHVQVIKKAMTDYEWHDEDFLLATYPKNGKLILTRSFQRVFYHNMHTSHTLFYYNNTSMCILILNGDED